MPNNTQVHNIRIVERLITYPKNDRWIQHCVKGDRLKIAWDEEWAYMDDIVVIFVNAADGVRKTMNATSGECEIPWEVLQTEGRVFLLVIGYQGIEQRICTQKMERPFLVNASGDIYDTLLPEVTEDILQQVLNASHDIDDAIAEATVLAREAQAIIDSIHVAGYNFDSLLEAVRTLAERNTAGSEDLWVVGAGLYASGDVIEYVVLDGAGGIEFKHASLIEGEEETGIEIGVS